MHRSSLLLERSIERGTFADRAAVGALLRCSPEAVSRALEHSRAVFESTKRKKRNPSQYRVIAQLTHEQKRFNRRLQELLYREKVDPAVHGYVRGRSIWTNLLAHFEEERLAVPLAWFGFDIADAFPAVSHRWVDRILAELYPHLSDSARAMLVNVACFRGRLDQGYPTSPVFFNLALQPLDEKLTAYCEPRSITYTRYADDFTFSAERDFSVQEKRELIHLAGNLPFRFRVVKVKEAALGEPFEVTHRSTERFRRRLLRDRTRGVPVSETIANLQLGVA